MPPVSLRLTAETQLRASSMPEPRTNQRRGGVTGLDAGAASPWSCRYHAASAGALYVHVPFCVRKCRYCDFPSRATFPGDAELDVYVDMACDRLRQLSDTGLLEGVRTVYVGGGTPSMLGPHALSRLLGTIRGLCDALEVSCEANPDTLGRDVIAAMLESGVTRVSVGVQSLVDDELGALGRLHDSAAAERALRECVNAGLDVSCDLMCGIPLQTEASWRSSLTRAADTGIGHMSVYPLSVEEGTALASLIDEGTLEGPDSDLQASMMRAAAEDLLPYGLARYEVASYATPGHGCAHNIAYWTGVSYASVGPGSSAMYATEGYDRLRQVLPRLPRAPRGAVRCRVTERLAAGGALASAGSGPSYLVEFLDLRQAVCEDLMLGARTCEGVSAALMDLAREVVGEADFDAAVRDILRLGLAVMTGGGALAPTERGWLLGNDLYARLWGLSVGTIETQECP